MGEFEGIRDWSAGLRAFTQRNAGRRTILEEDAEATGFREEGKDYPFRGASWDPRDSRIQIMLGDQASVERHLTRSIPAARAIDLMRDAEGRDRGLRIIHEGGETRLRFVRDEPGRSGRRDG
ncbi:MAG: hypothetical protein PVH00_06815 [Gemmatimonadota bacterium]|jgi:hypothetical protein